MTRQRRVWGRQVLPLWIAAVAFVSAAGGVTASAAHRPSPGDGPSTSAGAPQAAVIYLLDDQVTVSWRVRARESGTVLRLYRSGLEGGLVLLSERVTEPGVVSYHEHDVVDGLAPLSYRLRVVSPSGRETELASLLCVPLRMRPAAAVPPGSAHDAAVLTLSVEPFQLVWDRRPEPGVVRDPGRRPEPPTPPPRG